MKYALDFDQHGCALCPLCGPQQMGSMDAVECNYRGLYVVHELDVAVTKDDDDYGPESAVTGDWRVRCINGHVLLTSHEFGNGDEELPPEPFRLSMLVDPCMGARDLMADLEASLDRGAR